MKPLIISNSGGRTSAYMTKRLLDLYRGKRAIYVLFANTGEEDPHTLKFVRHCDEAWEFDTIWLEAVVDPEQGRGTQHKVVTYETAHRFGEVGGPYEAMVAKFGIANPSYPHCTRELKERPIISYARHLGLRPGDYEMAIGIRADEIDRMSSLAPQRSWIYPLVGWNIKERDVIDFWRQQNFDLYIPKHRGNCLWCWKKADRKIFTLVNEEPRIFDVPRRLEKTYGTCGANAERGRVFFRKNRSTLDMVVAGFLSDFEPFVDGDQAFDPDLDLSGGCGDTCEVFSDNSQNDWLDELV
ncbi:hypothetical protein EN780_04435 [Mesorhizobium sp. M4B.F.Ca.ET.089.01.1.1]|uniref:hypothetical protein n=1 Tax=Mesorhizobium sp. M4B.F.Ca.ET.089.01.1.1 TaxID=2496662 RepID=UPI000FE2A9D3|nr:hypothetical protein [Mesorhizobium sp. M4B.F.Ca.ET.089.01.1.1]RWX70037.1 hypothetical protein EN780_04435 [Mesorhizobium sp. M4B.F.Ca.ET.089.01.1.1]